MKEIAFTFEPTAHAQARKKEAAVVAAPRYPARVARQLALAHTLDRRVRSGEFGDYAAMARGLGLTRARVTQLMDLLLLAPDIQEEILALQVATGERQPFSERALRDSVSSLIWTDQRKEWAAFKALNASNATTSSPPLPQQ